MKTLLGMGCRSPLNAMMQANEQLQAAYRANAYFGQMTWNAEAQARCEREKFYRSCSQNWLNAMLDVELGSSIPTPFDGKTG